MKILGRMNEIWHIVLTGGPCAGKSTAITYLCQKLRQRGFIVIYIPEAATLCIIGGLSPVSEIVGTEIGQKAIAGLAFWMENIWQQAAEQLSRKAKVIVIHDRGIPDGSAYMPAKMYKKILAPLGLNPTYARDQRYNAVIHMVTAANGAEKFYTLANNAARYENAENARIQDERILAAWMGHEHLRVIDNSTDFKKKVRRVYNEISVLLGEPPVEKERKFLVSFKHKDLPSHTQPIDIEQFYPISDKRGVVLRFRKRGQDGFYTYFRTTKRPCGRGKNFEVQDFMSEQEYNLGLQFKRPDTAIVQKTRSCFVYQSQRFELDEFKATRAIPSNGLLEIEITDPKKKIHFPPWMWDVVEVTGDSTFSNFGIAQALAKKA
jgi:CYTH domain-containing protein/predicted ATPase